MILESEYEDQKTLEMNFWDSIRNTIVEGRNFPDKKIKLKVGHHIWYPLTRSFTLSSTEGLCSLCLQITFVGENAKNRNKICYLEDGLLESSYKLDKPDHSVSFVDAIFQMTNEDRIKSMINEIKQFFDETAPTIVDYDI